MTVHTWRLRFPLDPLIAEAKLRMRRRRVLIAAVVALLLAGVLGAALALRGPGGSAQGLASASVPGQFTFRYPVDWKRVDWSCSHLSTPLLLLTTARPTPTCGPSFPPQEQLRPNGVAVWIADKPYEPAVPFAENPDPQATLVVNCVGAGAPGRPLSAGIHDPGLLVEAVVCGPDYANGQAAVSRMLASIRG